MTNVLGTSILVTTISAALFLGGSISCWIVVRANRGHAFCPYAHLSVPLLRC
jgi:hypothetical protein